MPKIKNSTTAILWLIYIFLLAVLLPHTAWAFRAFEPTTEAWVIVGNFTSADLVSYIAAFAFEAAIAVLTHKLSEHIEQTAKAVRGKSPWQSFKIRYMNAFFGGLLIATLVSSLANLAHAVQFAKPLEIFAAWGIPQAVYVVAFGGVLPVVSLMFARVLSNVNDAEGVEDPIVTELRNLVAELRKQLREAAARLQATEGEAATRVQAAEAEKAAAEQRALDAEARFNAAGDLMRLLVSADKRERILAVRSQWPKLPGASIALMVDASPSYVSEVLKETVNA